MADNVSPAPRTLQDAVISLKDAEETKLMFGEHWGGSFKILSSTRAMGGARLGINQMRLPTGRATVPFHFHQREDEIFFIQSGRGIFRYGDELREVGAGDCISCPAGQQIAHQLGNPFEEDLVYLAVGNHDPEEVCVYPDTGKVMIRSLNKVGYLEAAEYFHGEEDEPPVFKLWREREGG